MTSPIARPVASSAMPKDVATEIDLHSLCADAGVFELLDGLDRELIGLAPVKTRRQPRGERAGSWPRAAICCIM